MKAKETSLEAASERAERLARAAMRRVKPEGCERDASKESALNRSETAQQHWRNNNPAKPRFGELRGMYLGMAVLAMMVMTACRDKEPSPAPEERFVPAEMVSFESEALNLRFRHPSNLTPTQEGEALVLRAPGIGPITVGCVQTEAAHSGTSSTRSGSRATWTRFESGRECSCVCDDVGEHRELIESICTSIERLHRSPQSELHWEIDGALQNVAVYQAALENAKPQLQQCWEEAVAADPELHAGELSLTYVYAQDGSIKSSAWSASATGEPFRQCAEHILRSIPALAQSDDVTVRIRVKCEL